jgi:hypothetical protein
LQFTAFFYPIVAVIAWAAALLIHTQIVHPTGFMTDPCALLVESLYDTLTELLGYNVVVDFNHMPIYRLRAQASK